MIQNLKHNRHKLFLLPLLIFALVLTACNAQTQTAGSFAQVPAGLAYAEGVEIYFTHTEASDPGIAETLTNMMKSPVLFVPSLALVPAESRANVYVFENGVTGKGPLGFQPDVFDNPPGTDGYSPLREIILVTWADGSESQELKAVSDILAAEADGQLSTNPTGVIVNMPFVVWDGGKR